MGLLCPVCEEGTLNEITKKTCLEFSNPGQIVVESKVSECDKCGEILLNEKESVEFAKKADKLLRKKDKAKQIEVHEGDILLI